MRRLNIGIVLVLVAGLAACASAPKEELSLEEQVAAALTQDHRPDHCELYPAGEFRILTDRWGRVPGGLESRIRGLGYHSTREVRRETTMERGASGTMEERVVALYGIGMKWNDPGCAVGRKPEESDRPQTAPDIGG